MIATACELIKGNLFIAWRMTLPTRSLGQLCCCRISDGAWRAEVRAWAPVVERLVTGQPGSTLVSIRQLVRLLYNMAVFSMGV